MRLLFTVLLLGLLNIAKGQITSDTIYIQKHFLSYSYYQGEERLNSNHLTAIMAPNYEAYELIRKARALKSAVFIVRSVGGSLMIWQAGISVISGEPDWTMLAIGGGLVAVSIPISWRSQKLTRRAIDVYNAGLKPIAARYHMSLEVSNGRIGLLLKF